MKTLIYIGMLFVLAAFSNQVLAQIELTTVAEIEVTETDAQGKKTVKRIPPRKVVPGTEVIYTITAKNTGNEPADNIVVTNPVPKHTEYVDGSAFGAGTNINCTRQLEIDAYLGRRHAVVPIAFQCARQRDDSRIRMCDSLPAQQCCIQISVDAAIADERCMRLCKTNSTRHGAVGA